MLITVQKLYLQSPASDVRVARFLDHCRFAALTLDLIAILNVSGRLVAVLFTSFAGVASRFLFSHFSPFPLKVGYRPKTLIQTVKISGTLQFLQMRGLVLVNCLMHAPSPGIFSHMLGRPG